MTCREYAKSVGFEVVGKLRRMKAVRNQKWYMDEAENEYWLDYSGKNCVCIVCATGGVI